MLKIVSYAYFRSATSIYEREKGNSALQFQQFIRMLVRAHHCVWPGFQMRLHVDEQVKALPLWPTIERYDKAGLLGIVHCGPTPELCKAMMWRLIPAMQGQDKIVVCRDVDSVPMPRDRWAVGEWEQSGKAVHVIHDASAHSGVMGGTLSVRSHAFQELVGSHSMEEFLELGADFDWSKQGADQHLLNRMLHLSAKFPQETLVHELHHRVNDMGPVEIRESICPMPRIELPLSGAETVEANKLCGIIGGCTDPAYALSFYDSIDFPERDAIRECEK